MAAINAPQRAQQEQAPDPLEKILTGLKIAATGYGIYSDYKKLENETAKTQAETDLKKEQAPLLAKKSALETEKLGGEVGIQKQEQEGVFTKARAAGLGTVYDQPVSGAIPIKYVGEDVERYLLPRSEAQLQAAKVTAGAALEEKRTKREEDIARRQIEGLELQKGKVPTDKAIEDVRNKAVSARDLISATNELEQLYKEYGVQATGPQKALMDQKVKDIIIQMKNIGGLGQISASDLDLLLKQVPDVSGFAALAKQGLGLSNDASIEAMFSGLKNGALSKLDNTAKTSGYRRVDSFGVSETKKETPAISSSELEGAKKFIEENPLDPRSRQLKIKLGL